MASLPGDPPYKNDVDASRNFCGRNTFFISFKTNVFYLLFLCGINKCCPLLLFVGRGLEFFSPLTDTNSKITQYPVIFFGSIP